METIAHFNPTTPDELVGLLGLAYMRLCSCQLGLSTNWDGNHASYCEIVKFSNWIFERFEPRSYVLAKRGK